MTLVALVPNLFDRSRFEGKAVFVETPEEAAAKDPSLLIVDLDRCPDITAFRLAGVPTVGFGPHVDSALHRAAVQAGYDEVMPRSVFFRRLPELLGSME